MVHFLTFNSLQTLLNLQQLPFLMQYRTTFIFKTAKTQLRLIHFSKLTYLSKESNKTLSNSIKNIQKLAKISEYSCKARIILKTGLFWKWATKYIGQAIKNLRNRLRWLKFYGISKEYLHTSEIIYSKLGILRVILWVYSLMQEKWPKKKEYMHTWCAKKASKKTISNSGCKVRRFSSLLF